MLSKFFSMVVSPWQGGCQGMWWSLEEAVSAGILQLAGKLQVAELCSICPPAVFLFVSSLSFLEIFPFLLCLFCLLHQFDHTFSADLPEIASLDFFYLCINYS